jgi:hypothetical protein
MSTALGIISGGERTVGTFCMRCLHFVVFLFLNAMAVMAQPAKAAEVIAKVVSATPSFRASGQNLRAGSEIVELARLSTTGSGRGEVMFIDGTKLAMGPSSNLKITKSLMRGRNKFSKLGIAASRGAYRWISGSSGSSSYALSTPVSTLGIRGTALDITIRGGRTYIALLSGRARICGGGGCQELRQTCDFVEVSGKITKAQQISAGFKSRNAAASVFPFMADPSTLSGRFRVGGRNCLSPVRIIKRNEPVPQIKVKPAPPPPPPPEHGCEANCDAGKGDHDENRPGEEDPGK